MKHPPQCIDCKWCEFDERFPEASGRHLYARCNAPQNMKDSGYSLVDAVLPSTKRRWEYCRTNRQEKGRFSAWAVKSCGQRGRWFQAKGEK